MEDSSNGSVFHDDKFVPKNGNPKELFLSSDANAVVEHTKKVLVIEDGEVVHLKVLDFILFSLFFVYVQVYKFFHLSLWTWHVPYSHLNIRH
jgi:hypothetical protein